MLYIYRQAMHVDVRHMWFLIPAMLGRGCTAYDSCGRRAGANRGAQPRETKGRRSALSPLRGDLSNGLS